MRKIKIYVFTVITMFCITENSNSTGASDNPPSAHFYFNLNHDTVVKELTSNIREFDKATNDNIINMVQSTTNELKNICEDANNSDGDLTNQMNKYTKTVRKLSDDFTQVSQTLEKDKQRKMSDSIDECLSNCEGTLKIIENKPVTHSSPNQMSILEALKLNK